MATMAVSLYELNGKELYTEKVRNKKLRFRNSEGVRCRFGSKFGGSCVEK